MEQKKGYVSHIVYRNAENGYSVLNLVCGGEELICVGMLRTIDEGETLEVKGEFVEHPVYGAQLKIESYQITEPDDVVSMERYLGSGAIKGIGEALAARIVKHFKEDTFRIIEEEPERLAEIRGISDRKAREIALLMEEKREMREAMMFLQKYGIGGTLAVKIYNTYGLKLYGILKENPYQLAEGIGGVGFRIADEIANKVGILADSEYRIRSGILYVLLQASAEGHVYLPSNLLIQRTADLLGIEKMAIEPQIGNLAMDKKLVVKQGAQEEEHPKVYSAPLYYKELNCAKMLHDLNVTFPIEEGMGRDAAEKKIDKLGKEQGLLLDELQKKAVVESIGNGLLLLTGGPGTGKTTVINTIIHFFVQEGMDIFLAAPTGRAAKRMTEATGYEARTIHRLLEIGGALPEENGAAKFERNEENPLEADVIIIDEMSMVDIHLFTALLRAILPGTRLILVGDMNQLPSVGPGQILKDLIDSQSFPVVMLKRIFRQAEESDIVMNAHRINEGKEISLNNKSKDFFFLERKEVQVIYKHMIQLISEKLPKYVDAKPYEIQVLTPMRKGNLGVEYLNGILQKYLNPPSDKKKEHTCGETLFREGDKVMQVKNNYQLEWEVVSRYGIPVDRGIGVFNGDMGLVLEINEYSQEIVVEYDEQRRVRYPFAQMEELELAYAITIHKAQGSEYPAVIMPLLGGPKMLFNRNLLYTGVTRAKSCVTIMGSSQTISEMIANEQQNKRYTGLSERILELQMTQRDIFSVS